MGDYIALYIHLIWTTKHREPVLHKGIRYDLFDHIRSEANKNGIDMKIISGVDDHVRCLIALKSTQNAAGVVKAIKGESSR